jgi:hypothetical protein
MMEKRSGERSGQVGEGSGSNASLPTAVDLEALEQGIKEGLAEGPTVETAPQDAVEPRAPAGMVNEPFVPPRNEEESSEELSGTMDTPMRDDPEFQVDTTMDDPMPEEATQSDLSLGEPASDLMEDIVEPPTAQKATRVPSWKRELAASTSERIRVTTPYGLRTKPTKKVI